MFFVSPVKCPSSSTAKTAKAKTLPKKVYCLSVTMKEGKDLSISLLILPSLTILIMPLPNTECALNTM